MESDDEALVVVATTNGIITRPADTCNDYARTLAGV
jgi:hypothetical protein